jgi:hypothetical protein
MLEVNGNSERLMRSYSELVELQLVLEKAGSFFDQARMDAQVKGAAGGGARLGDSAAARAPAVLRGGCRRLAAVAADCAGFAAGGG